MGLTAPHREPSGALAQGPATGTSLAPMTLPVWAVEPWFWIGFRCAQLSSIHRVLLYYNLSRVARRGWLGPRPEPSPPIPTELSKHERQGEGACSIVSGPWAHGSRFPAQGPRQDGSGTPGQV